MMSEVEKYKRIMDETTLSEQIINNLKNMYVEKESKTIKWNNSIMKYAACLILIFGMGGTAYAAYRYLSMPEVAKEIKNDTLEQLFKSESAKYINETQESGDYLVTFIGSMSTTDLEKTELKGNYEKEQMYTVFAIKKTNNKKMLEKDLEKQYCVTPVIPGVNPLKVNSYTMQGGMIKMLHDGVIYILYNQKEIECFANENVKLAINDGRLYNEKAFVKEGETIVNRNPDYQGISALFNLPLDAKNADNEKAKELIRLWNGTKEETGACELKLTSWNEQPIDQGALSITHVFNKEICVVSELSKVTFFNENGRKITTCSINNDANNGAYFVKTYNTPKYVVIVMKEGERFKYALINEKHEVERIVQLDSNIVLESSDQILVCPEQGRIVYEHLRNEKDDLIYEICSCNYASKDLKVLYKVKDLKTESIGKMDDISQMQLSQDGTTIFLSGLYFDSNENGSTSKYGIGYIDLIHEKVKFYHGGNDGVGRTISEQTVYYSSGAENGNVVILNKKGKQKAFKLQSASEIPYLYLSQDGKKLYTVSELKPQKTVLKCYDVAKSECKWTKEIDANRSIIDVLDFGKLLVLIKDETTGKVEIKEEGAEQKRE